MTEQTKQLQRVRVRLSDVVIEFCRRHRHFQMADLATHIALCLGGAPDSPGRILRDLRQRGVISYRVVSRQASAYEVTEVAA